MQLIGEREQVPVVRWACVSVGGNQSVVWRLGVRELAAQVHPHLPLSPQKLFSQLLAQMSIHV